MPELTFRLRWPDETETIAYSPSTIVRQYLTPGATYELEAFIQRARQALRAASSRVEEKYGFPCARAQGTLSEIERRAAAFASQPGAAVTITAMAP